MTLLWGAVVEALPGPVVEVLSDACALAVVTHPRIYKPPTPTTKALGQVAALCLHHDVRELWSADRDFTRFEALRVRNPLVGWRAALLQQPTPFSHP